MSADRFARLEQLADAIGLARQLRVAGETQPGLAEFADLVEQYFAALDRAASPDHERSAAQRAVQLLERDLRNVLIMSSSRSAPAGDPQWQAKVRARIDREERGWPRRIWRWLSR